MRHALKTVLATAAMAAASMGSVGCSAMKSGSMASVQPVTTNERVGSAYLFRGWIGVFSTGIDELGTQLSEDGVHAAVYQDTQAGALATAMIEKYKDHPDHEPIVLIGHSYGADDVVTVARRLAEHNIQVDLLVTLDPVTPGKVPGNTKLAYNLYQPSAMDNLPFLRGIPLTPDEPGPATLMNINVRKDRPELIDGGVDHFNIEKKPKIHEDVIAQVLKACPPRGQWLASRGMPTGTVIASAANRSPAGLQITSARSQPRLEDEVTGKGDAGNR